MIFTFYSRRYVGNGSAFEQIVRVYRDHAKTRWSQGGNAPVMANRLAMEGCEVLLGARTTPNVKFSDHVRGVYPLLVIFNFNAL